jgi:protein TonB
MKTLTFSLFLLAATTLSAHAQSDTAQRQIDTIWDHVKIEIESEFPGGPHAWMDFLNNHFTYPKKAIKRNIQGTVLLQFIVEKDGSLSSITALTGDPLLQEAALKVINESPKWRPAIQNGKVVRSWKKQPIVFRLQ